MHAKGRRGSRRLLLQALYQAQLAGHSADDLQAQFAGQAEFAAADQEYFRELLARVIAERDLFDAHISEYGDIVAEQLDPVERAILWIALAEICSRPDVPNKVIINEAVELGKRYGAEGGYRYVNAVLDKAMAGLRQGAA